MNLQTTKTKLEILTSSATLIGGIVAAGWALHEYLGKKAEGRVEQTLEYRQAFYRNPVLSARRAVDAAWTSEEDRAVNLLRGFSNPPTKAEVESWTKFVSDLVKDKKLAAPIDLMVEFYDDLRVCVQREICDESTALQLFGANAIRFANQHDTYLFSVRAKRNDGRYSDGVRWIAIRASKASKK